MNEWMNEWMNERLDINFTRDTVSVQVGRMYSSACFVAQQVYWTRHYDLYRSMATYPWPHFQSESSCSTILVKMSLICMWMETYYHMKGLARGLVLKMRPRVIRKWAIVDEFKCWLASLFKIIEWKCVGRIVYNFQTYLYIYNIYTSFEW